MGMLSLFSLSFVEYSLLFLVSSFFIFWAPGFSLFSVAKKQYSAITSCVVSMILGMCVWAAQGYIFGYAHVRFMTYIYVIGILGALFFKRRRVLKELHRYIVAMRNISRLLLVLLLIGAFLQIFQMFGNGLLYADGARFFRTNAYDGMFHLGLIEHIIREFPPTEPSASKLAVRNYHYWSDLMMAEQARIFHLPVSFLFFQMYPILVALLGGLGVLALLHEWKADMRFAAFALFFFYFGADAGYIVYYFIHHTISFQYPVIDNGVTQFLNMPHAIAKMMFLGFLILLHLWMKEKKIVIGMCTALVCAALVGVKIYFGLFAACMFGGMWLLSLFEWFLQRKKKNSAFLIQFTVILTLAALGALAIYLPPNKGAGGLTWAPLEWPKLFLAQDNLDWRDWRYKYAVAQYLHDSIHLYYYDVLAIIACLLAVYGTRVLGFFVLPSYTKFFGKKWLFVCTIGVFGYTFLGLYTLQQSGGFNVFNFFAVAITLLSIFAAYSLSLFTKKRDIFSSIFVAIIIVFTLPRIVYETQTMWARYLHNEDSVIVTNGELSVFAYVRAHTDSHAIIQSPPDDRLDSKSSYLAAMTGRDSYIAGTYLLETHNQPFKARVTAVNDLFSKRSLSSFEEEARELGISYVYYDRSSQDQTLRLFVDNGRIPFVQSNDTVVYTIQ
ncbi:hypothetical protein C5B42_04975 [Candidatus Cerribacteria bacterium 'Amazon FNV 2010 28 9']|uniref:Glycosyltransferase RgtA/B/C/D-like domain-containing protein n=1 Tax=Candidatus Cerribacteria bacterium 'Amazon FNV 2010 28 9' TaxID=2081795 RepID=A0A317JQC4_9BACT|nr:MAG: hypothetical protein C5B42_04975 [Candidatus Cerribacteria bacterium 'Amazon FNV 2010 28 9']